MIKNSIQAGNRLQTRFAKSKKLVIFGAGDIAELAHYYFTNDSEYEVAGFCVDAKYLTGDTFCGLPVVEFERVESVFPPGEYCLFVALSYSRLNAIRKEKYIAAKAKGYELPSYVSSLATVLNNDQIGENCFILEDNTIQPFVEIGDNVVLWSGNHIGHHSVIESHCFLASHVVVSGGVKIGESCFVGVNVTLRDHISVGERAVLGAGSVILGDVAADGVYKASSTERLPISSEKLTRI